MLFNIGTLILFFNFIFILSPTSFYSNAFFKIQTLDEKKDPVFKKFKYSIRKKDEIWKKHKNSFKTSHLKEIGILSFAEYTVEKNETIFSIAKKMALLVDTLISVNSLAGEESIKENSTLLIPNLNGITVFPEKNTSLAKIAYFYKTPISLLRYVNNILDRDFIFKNEEIFIPFAKMTDDQKSFFLTDKFQFPVNSGYISSLYGMRKHPIKKRFLLHGGVDIAVPKGTPVYSSLDGVILFAGNKGGYGKIIIIKHKYGYTTWYGHLRKILVKKNQTLSAGKKIAYSGDTGITTGPHLHFEIRRFNKRQNPLETLVFDHSNVKIV